MIGIIRQRTRTLAAEGDSGIGLVEVLVGLLVVTVTMTAFGHLLVQSLRAQQSDNLKASANGLSIAELEGMQALPWAVLGHYVNDGPSAVNSVSLGATRPAGSRAPRPQSISVRAGRGTYTVKRAVVWVVDPATSNPTDYKRLSVEITWTGPSGAQRVQVDSIRTPQVGELAPSDFALRSATPSPLDVALNATGETAAPLTLLATVSSAGTAANASWTNRSGTTSTRTLTGSDGGRTWSTVVPVGTCCFPNAHLPFVFTVSRTTPATTVTGTQTAALLETLAVTQVAASPATQCATSSGMSSLPVIVTVASNGTVDGDPVTVTSSAGGSWTATVASTTSSGNTWTVQVPAGDLPVGSSLTASASRTRPASLTAVLTSSAGVSVCPP
jgi:hypothetical protein